ncbi:hypothetical protein S83_028194 [Arachis hypogaea]
MLLMRCILGRETIRTGHRIRGRYKPSRSLETSWRISRQKSSRGYKEPSLRNRIGPVHMPYTLLLLTSDEGLTFRGIPNSISI